LRLIRTRTERSSDNARGRPETRSRLPDTHLTVEGKLTSFLKLGAATLVRAADFERFLLETVTEALPKTEPTAAVTVPLPVLAPVNVTGLPGFGEKLPSAGETDHVGFTDTALP
jgi:hypothetical protein